MWASPQGCFNVLTVWQLTSRSASAPGDQGRSHAALDDLASEVTCHSCLTLSVAQTDPDALWDGTDESGKTRQASLGASVKAGHHRERNWHLSVP